MTATPVPVPVRRDHETRGRWILVAGSLVVALCIGYVAAARSHRLDHGSSWWHEAGAESHTVGSTTEMRFEFGPGRQVTFGVTIRNPGPWSVTITGIAVDDGP